MDSNGSIFSHFSVCSTLWDRSQMARLIKPVWNGGWTSIQCELFWCLVWVPRVFGSIALSGIDRASTGCWHDIAGKMMAHLGTDPYPWNIMKPLSLRRWTSATPPESTTKCIVFFQCMGKQFDDLDLSLSHSNHQKKKRGIGASWKTEFQHKWWDFVSKIGWFGIWKNNELCIFWYLTGPVPLIAGPISSELSGSRNLHSNTMAPWLFPRPGPPMVRLEELSQTLGFSKEKDFHLQSIPQLGEICFASGESCYSHGWNRWFQWNSWEWHGHIQNNGYDIIGKDDSDLLV